MKSALYEIQDACIQFSYSLSVMMRVDVEIVDKYHNRVAATGHFLERLNQNNINDGHAYSDVLEKGIRLFVEDPSKSHYCEGCKERDFCEIKLEIGAPILVDGKIEGVIGLTCWDEKQKEYILSQYKQYTYFLDQMCSLIADKVKERRMIQRNISFERILHSITPMVHQGVIILDSEGRILDINEIAREKLGLAQHADKPFANIVLCGSYNGDYEAYKVILDGQIYMIHGKEFRAYESNGKYSQILVMQPDPGVNMPKLPRKGGSEEITPIDQLEKAAILHALEVCGSTEKGKQKAADALGIGISTLYRKLKSFDLSK